MFSGEHLPTKSFRPRWAFTLIEVLIIVAIIATLLGLLLPAILKVREAAARSQCMGHLKQLGVAIHNYHDTMGSLPPSRLYDQYASWAVLILPYISHDSVFKQWNLANRYDQQVDSAREAQIKTFYCPSRRSDPQFSSFGTEPLRGSCGDYAGNAGSRNNYIGELDGWQPPKDNQYVEPANANGTIIAAGGCRFQGEIGMSPLLEWHGRLMFADIVDGTSNTLLLGERHVPESKLLHDAGDAAIFNGDHHRTLTRLCAKGKNYGMNLAKNARDLDGPSGSEERRWQRIFGSWHPGVCNFLLADASLRSINNTIDIIPLTHLANRQDNLMLPVD